MTLPGHSGNPSAASAALAVRANSSSRPRVRCASDRVAAKHDRVVLVGRHGLLAAPFAADCEPAPLHVVERELRAQQLEQAVRQRVVQRGDRVRERLGRRALRDQVVGEGRDVRDTAFECRHVAREPDRLGHVAHRHALRPEQVALGDDAHEFAAAHHEQLVKPPARHQGEAFLRRGEFVDHHGSTGHDVRDGRRQRRARQHDALHEVDQREDSHRPARVVDDRDRAHALGAHALERVTHRRVRQAIDRVAPHQRLDRLDQGLLLGGAVREVMTQLAERVLHQRRERLGAELLRTRVTARAAGRSPSARAAGRRRPRSPRTTASRPSAPQAPRRESIRPRPVRRRRPRRSGCARGRGRAG